DLAPANIKAPRTPEEAVLCELFAEVLGLEKVGIEDNFFELGGDSIVSIQLVSRARQAGLLVTPKSIFQNPTVYKLARVTQTSPQNTSTQLHLTTGVASRTPIISWLLEQKYSINKFNQSTIVKTPPQLNSDQLNKIFQHIIDHHHSLRMNIFQEDIEGKFNGILIRDVGSVKAIDHIKKVYVDRFTEREINENIKRELDLAIGSLDPKKGEIIKIVWFTSNGIYPGRLLIVIHHLAIDAVSWKILLSDLEICWNSVRSQDKLTPLIQGTSFVQWGKKLIDYAQTKEVTEDLPIWLKILKEPIESTIPINLKAGKNSKKKREQLTAFLDADITEKLLSEVALASDGKVTDVLLTALVLSVASLNYDGNLVQSNALKIYLEGHGREDVFADVDISSTVGWFTTLFPVHLDPGLISFEEIYSGKENLLGILTRIKEQLRIVPNNGLTYGLLRYTNPNTSEILSSLPIPKFCFNYLGKIANQGDKYWQPIANCEISQQVMINEPLFHDIEINCQILSGNNGSEFHATITWDSSNVSDVKIEKMAWKWMDFLGLFANSGVIPHTRKTPSDIELIKVTQQQISLLENKYPIFDNIYPMSPLQSGILFHAMYENKKTDVYKIQVEISLEGELNEKALNAALKKLHQRHPNLRAVFSYDQLSEPVEIITHEESVNIEKYDLSNTSNHLKIEKKFLGIRDKIQRHAFDLEQQPLVRYILIKLNSTNHRLIISIHHALIDGWSLSIILDEIKELYSQNGSDKNLNLAPSYKKYFKWLRSLDYETAKLAWGSYLNGINEGTILSKSTDEKTQAKPLKLITILSANLTDAILKVGRFNNLTANSVLQAAWSILLGRLTNSDCVIFGSTVSGRNPDVINIDKMVGLFINTLPVKVKITPDLSFIELGETIQLDYLNLSPYQYLGLSEIQKCTGITKLFDTLFIFENYPISTHKITSDRNDISFKVISSQDATHYPLTISVFPGDQLQICFGYQDNLFDLETIQSISDRFIRLLESAVANPDQSISKLSILSPDERHT
ncbi:condensation domain-containing protein, partial [Polynucleobacter sp. MG-28-Ekke-A2]|uniref:condensation domain-containing protein n=1 Tax=Polynucleobacter sp. MG-28-Ekke-A2 TaxID=3108276 RepID=UPI002B235C2D